MHFLHVLRTWEFPEDDLCKINEGTNTIFPILSESYLYDVRRFLRLEES